MSRFNFGKKAIVLISLGAIFFKGCCLHLELFCRSIKMAKYFKPYYTCDLRILPYFYVKRHLRCISPILSPLFLKVPPFDGKLITSILGRFGINLGILFPVSSPSGWWGRWRLEKSTNGC